MKDRFGRRSVFRPARVLGAGALLCLLGARPAPGDWSLEGHYAAVNRVASVARVPVMGSERSVTTTLLLVDVEREGGRWMQRQTVCDVRVQSSRARMVIPEAFVRSIRPRSYPVRQDAENAYTADLGLQTVGFDPAVTGGAMPTRADQAGVVDSDGDGQPGATVVGHFPVFGRVRLFIAQRTHVVLRGRQTSPDRVEGGIDVLVLEQRTLDASNRIFRRTLDVAPDQGKSSFTMVRTGARTCEELKRGEATLFAE